MIDWFEQYVANAIAHLEKLYYHEDATSNVKGRIAIRAMGLQRALANHSMGRRA